jgi:hypothetical protein
MRSWQVCARVRSLRAIVHGWRLATGTQVTVALGKSRCERGVLSR